MTGETIASSFGQMNQPEKRNSVDKSDLACAALTVVTNNIGSIAFLCARADQLERIVFVGNFLRANPIASRLLAEAMKFWSVFKDKSFCDGRVFLNFFNTFNLTTIELLYLLKIFYFYNIFNFVTTNFSETNHQEPYPCTVFSPLFTYVRVFANPILTVGAIFFYLPT